MDTCLKAWKPVLAAGLVAAAPVFADECSEFRDSIDASIAADGYDAVVVALHKTIDAWSIVQESNHWNSAADTLTPALVASKESASAASDKRDKAFRLRTSATGGEDDQRTSGDFHSRAGRPVPQIHGRVFRARLLRTLRVAR